eukprot:scaffold228083_cov32-Tisochrysis_lutea.AAC.2
MKTAVVPAARVSAVSSRTMTRVPRISVPPARERSAAAAASGDANSTTPNPRGRPRSLNGTCGRDGSRKGLSTAPSCHPARARPARLQREQPEHHESRIPTESPVSEEARRRWRRVRTSPAKLRQLACCQRKRAFQVRSRSRRPDLQSCVERIDHLQVYHRPPYCECVAMQAALAQHPQSGPCCLGA